MRSNEDGLFKETRFSSMKKQAPGQSKLPGNKPCHISYRPEMYTVFGLHARTLLMWFLLHQFRGLDGHQIKSLKCLDFTSESDRLLGMNGD